MVSSLIAATILMCPHNTITVLTKHILSVRRIPVDNLLNPGEKNIFSINSFARLYFLRVRFSKRVVYGPAVISITWEFVKIADLEVLPKTY